ncbi:hypothetical protein ACG83_17105 [Frankia sp. R43]|uniref:hypothetical protein n=1 Tax=Frankia sp. R43 TaxID=269536 RepID=UPI0006CA2EC0|nr:hypothetical protein [Frankia sp. R43]KPM55053.1 hypothetical protein ACG83_17105 [Frankia sp. R43]
MYDVDGYDLEDGYDDAYGYHGYGEDDFGEDGHGEDDDQEQDDQARDDQEQELAPGVWWIPKPDDGLDGSLISALGGRA